MKHCLTFLPDANLATKIPDMSGKNLTYGNPKLRAPLATLLQEKFVERNVAKEPKSSHIAK